MLEPYNYIENGINYDNIDYISEVNEWCLKNHKKKMVYRFSEGRILNHFCEVTLPLFNEWFASEGRSKKEALRFACAKAYAYIQENPITLTIKDVIGEVKYDTAVSDL